MRTFIILACGFTLWLVCLGVAKLAANMSAAAATWATIAFAGIWFIVAAVNMWIGVTQAGYAFKEELPIFLLIFLTPVVVAVFVKWKFL